MKRFHWLPLIALVLIACHSLPEIAPDKQDPAGIAITCREAFPRQPWRMVHTIKTDFPGQRKGVMMGVVALVPEAKTVECALLSIEGLRLFEAHDDGTLTIRRALPPFDRPALAEGMMRDIRLLFFPPEGPLLLTGRMPSGDPGCRYALADGYEDITRKPTGDILIQRYDQRNRLTRRVDITRCHPDSAPGKEAVACRIHLEAFQPTHYQLELDLIEARPAVDNPSKSY
jgi:hypothetical protein